MCPQRRVAAQPHPAARTSVHTDCDHCPGASRQCELGALLTRAKRSHGSRPPASSVRLTRPRYPRPLMVDMPVIVRHHDRGALRLDHRHDQALCRIEDVRRPYTYAPDCMPLAVAATVKFSLVIPIGAPLPNRLQGAIRGWIAGDLHVSHLGVVAVLSIARREGNFRTGLVVMSGLAGGLRTGPAGPGRSRRRSRPAGPGLARRAWPSSG